MRDKSDKRGEGGMNQIWYLLNHELLVWGIFYFLTFMIGFSLSHWKLVWGFAIGQIVLLSMTVISDDYWLWSWLAMLLTFTGIIIYIYVGGKRGEIKKDKTP